MLRHEEMKGLSSTPGQGLGLHQNNNHINQSTGPQSSNGPTQNQQFPGMPPMAAPFYYPYGYGNQFYSGFPQFPMYQGGAQTPPHGVNKPPGVASTPGIGGNASSAYGAASASHLHSGAPFDPDANAVSNNSGSFHQPSPGLSQDFPKGMYTSAQGMGFLGGMGGGPGLNPQRASGNVAQGTTAASTENYKPYGQSTQLSAEKGAQNQAVRGAPNLGQGQQPLYSNNNRFQNQNQGYPQQGENYYSGGYQQRGW